MDVPAIFSPDYVRQLAIRQLHLIADQLNARLAQQYFDHYRDVELNWKAQGRKIEHYDPPKAWAVLEQELRLYETQVPVTPKRPDPWTLELEEPGQPVVVGPKLADGIYAAAGSTAPPGTRTVIDGQEYELVQIGEPGTIVYRLLWVRI